MFKGEDKIKEKKRFNEITDFKFNMAISYDKKEDYYIFLRALKEDMEKHNEDTIKGQFERQLNYIHFRKGNDIIDPKSNSKENIFKITSDKKPLNLKDIDGFRSFLYSIKEIDIFNAEYLDNNIGKEKPLEKYIFDLLISEIYKYIEAKYNNREDITLRDVFYCMQDYRSVFEKYINFTESKMHSAEVFNVINAFFKKETTVKLMDKINNHIDKNIVHEELDFTKIFFNRSGIELFSCDHNYSSAFLNYFIKKRIDKRFKEGSKENDITYILMDNYSSLLMNNRIPILRSLGVRIIYPASDVLKESYIALNSKNMHINDYNKN